ncbi:MAG: hypothetical protein WBY88_14705, partial [Desulfosarcina sp.]
MLPKNRYPLLLLIVIAGWLCFTTAPSAADSAKSSKAGEPAVADDNPDSETADDGSFAVGTSWRGRIAPGADLYPAYMADPLQPTLAIQYLFVMDSDIPDAGDSRFLHNLGGRFGLLRFYPDGRPEAGFQIDIQAAYIGMFDNDNSQDNIGWDGVYG